ncbi:MAG TPA: sulfite exporter TauE/SafE family protein [Chlamydiales bacterium]|nr:sulfite exporter TauE/SafE family protein [Chlamydiales bacterium]HPE84775.1 sulfite exporter TauE/SafE family protein [Chlamydiales bacterium]
MEWYWIICLIAVGIVAGLLSGLIGISGGVIAVPSLLFILRYSGMPEEHLMHVAVSTSLSSMTFNSFSSMMAHHRRHGVVWDATLKMLPGLLLGSAAGALIAGLLASGVLEVVFGVFECALGLYFLRALKQKEDCHPLPSFALLCAAAFLISGIATILGIGGGLLVTPLLVFMGFKMRKAVGTAAASSFVVCLAGAISYLVLGLKSGDIIPDCIGFIHFPAFFCIILTAPFAAILGAYLTHTLPVNVIRRIFGLALILAGIAVIW